MSLYLDCQLLSRCKFTVTAAKEVASALDVLTSNGIHGCPSWCDNNAFEVLVADYFTRSADDSLEESDNDDISIPLL